MRDMKYETTNSRTRRAVMLALAAHLFLLFAAGSLQAQQGARAISYVQLLNDAAGAPKDGKADQLQDVLSVLSDGGSVPDAATLVTRLKSNWPAYDPGAPVRILPEMRSRLVESGPEFERLTAVAVPLLKFCGLDGRVRPLLFKSEVPVVAFIHPNALVFSTRALQLLDAAEVEAVAAHELSHLIVQPIFRRAVDEHDDRAMRLVELFCDASAAAIVAARGGDTRRLISGYEKMSSVLEVELQQPQGGSDHPPMKLRKKLNQALYEQFRASAQPASLSSLRK